MHRSTTSYGEQPDAGSYPPNCSIGTLPTHILVVDDLPDGTIPAGVGTSRGCGAVKSSGMFSLGYVPWDNQMDLTHDGTDNPTTVTAYPGKLDTHQIGAGYGNHFYQIPEVRLDNFNGGSGRQTSPSTRWRSCRARTTA
ncbi:hypothetical protein [Streptomyces wuyuanensis]|uniref:hypothetical protein n=1 Tax=Streptomyces wuyuanensis TaxID=1196353 RepID=UPI0037BC11C2